MDDRRKMNKRVATSVALNTFDGEDEDEENDYKSQQNENKVNKAGLEIMYLQKKKKKKKVYIKFLVLSLAILTKSSAVVDALTDAVLLYKAAEEGAVLFTMILFISLISPYILSYSSGIELWLHRRTFEHVKPMTFKSVLLALYLFPTGILYFMMVDVIDIIVELYKWFVFNIIYCCKKEEELVLIESSVAGAFGMSRMNWISFRKQKRIAQLFFETIPQVSLQCLLILNIIPGKEISGVNDRDLMISICSAAFNSTITIFKLYAESVAVEESFVRYALTNITARYSWVPFTHKIHKFFNDAMNNETRSKSNVFFSIRMATKKNVLDASDESDVRINYKIKYRYPLITCLNSSVAGTVDYDFSSVSTDSLIATLKSYRNITTERKLKIFFGSSLRLLGVRDIIKLMQCLSEKNIYLPDIAFIDWELAFNNELKRDVRLFSNHFDESHRPLLISLYLTGYDNLHFSILSAFISEFDVPINITDDDGNTLMHHMIINNDIAALRALRNSLKFNQRIHISEMNNLGETVMYLALQHDIKLLTKSQKDKKEYTEEEKEEKQLETVSDYKYNADDEFDDILNGFEKIWLNAIQHNTQNDDNYIHPNTLINFLHLKVNITAVKLKKKSIKDPAIHVLKQRTVGLYQEFNRIMKSKNMEHNLVEIIDTNIESNDEDDIIISKSLQSKLIHLLLLKEFSNININAVIYNNQTVLGFVLLHFIDFVEYFTITKYLLDHGARLLASEIRSLPSLFVNAASRPKYHLYLNLFDAATTKSNIETQSIVDGHKNNPLHIVIMANDNNDTGKYIQILSCLCNRYSEWMYLKNNDKDTPIETAIKNNDVDAVVYLYRMMSIGRVLTTDRKTVNGMILLGNYLLSKKQGTVMHLLLQCLEYFDFWYWPSRIAHSFDMSDAPLDLDWISLVNYVSKQTHKKTLQDILIEIGAITYDDHENEFEDGIATGDASKGKKSKKQKNDDDDDETKDDVKEEEVLNPLGDEKESLIDNVIAIDETEEERDTKQPINWLEIAYSTVVETFSFLDLYTDIIIFNQLYKSNNMWWTSWMLMLLLAPYLVSYGSLATIFQNNISYVNHPLKSIFILFMMTPLAILYLLTIDVVFILYALLSTFLFLISCTKIDIRESIDRYIFEKIFNMNRTEVVGYRRLRTLSQLFFETMPQILLQLRILWVIEWIGDDSFQIDQQTIIWSVSLAFSHLILEGGIIYLDSKALRMDFLEYSMVCLGGRVHWVPFQHLLNQIVMKQVYIYYNIDDEEADFNVNECKLQCNHDEYADDNEFRKRQENQLILNYEAISANVHYFEYPVTYQFSCKAMQKLSERLTNCSPLQIPEKFNISDANSVLHSVMKNVLCLSQINLGYISIGNVDIYSFCGLYEACGLNKVKLNIKSIDQKTVHKMILNTTNKMKINAQITKSLINFGEISAIKWIHKDPKGLDYGSKYSILSDILYRCLSTNKDMFVRIDILRNCYQNKCLIGRDCKIMSKILAIIDDQYAEKCELGDASCCFAVIFILLYARGHIFFSECINGCCRLNDTLKSSIVRYLPSMVEVDEKQIPFELFDCCTVLNDYLEEMLLNHFKHWMILNTVQYIAKIEDTVSIDATQIQIDALSAGITVNNGTTMIDDLKQCDALISSLNVRKLDIYLKNTLEHRTFNESNVEIAAQILDPTVTFEKRIALHELLSKENLLSHFASVQIEFKEFACTIDEKEDGVDIDCKIYFCDDDVQLLDEVYLINNKINIKSDAPIIKIPMHCGISSFNHYIHSKSNPKQLMIKLSSVDEKKIKFSSMIFKMRYFNLGKDELGRGFVDLKIKDNPNYFMIDDDSVNTNQHNYVIQLPIKARFHFFPPISDYDGVKDVVQFGIQSVCEFDTGTGHAASLLLEQSSVDVISKQSIRYDHDGEVINKPLNERPRLDRFEFGDIISAEVVFSKKTLEYFVNGKRIHKTSIPFAFPWHFAIWKKRPSSNCKIIVIQDEFILNKLRDDYNNRLKANHDDDDQ